jgi:hypothetical protein
MALDSSNVRVAVTGVISVGTAAAAAPTNGTSALGTGWADLGYAGEDGVTETRDRSTNTIRGWQNGDVLREVVTEASVTYQTVLVETKKETVELYYGGTVDNATGSLVIVPASTGGRKKFVLDIIDGDEYVRAYIPEGEVVEVGDQVYANGEPIGYDVTIRAYPSSTILDADGNPGSVKKWYSSLIVAP